MKVVRDNKQSWEAAVKFIRRLVASLAALAFSSAAYAQSYPDHPVKLIVGFAPGGPTDVIARILAEKLAANLGGKQFYVLNMPGAGSNTASGAAASSPADGYTLLVVSTGFLINPTLFAKVSYDPVKDFAPISMVAASPNVVTVHPSVPAKTMKELVAFIKANPGKYGFAAPGVGSTPHLSGEIFRASQDIDLVTVQFTGAGPAIQSTVGGHTIVAFSALPPAAALIKDGLLRALAEAGFEGQEAYTLTGIMAPAGTPKEIIGLLHREIVKLVTLPDVQKTMADLGFDVVANTPDEFAVRMKVEMEKWGKVIRDAKIKVE